MTQPFKPTVRQIVNLIDNYTINLSEEEKVNAFTDLAIYFDKWTINNEEMFNKNPEIWTKRMKQIVIHIFDFINNYNGDEANYLIGELFNRKINGSARDPQTMHINRKVV